MSKPSEEISKYNVTSAGKTDSNLSNDSNHLGGIAAEDYATKKYVQDYHNFKEETLKEDISEQDKATLTEAKAYTDKVVASQDFSSFAKLTDVQALDTKLQNKITEGDTEQKNYTDIQIQSVVDDVNASFEDVNTAITTLNDTTKELFQSVSNGKSLVAGAITDKGVSTSASDSFSTMATNIRSIPTSSGGGTGGSGIDTSDATATAADILLGKTAYVNGQKVYGQYVGKNEAESGDDINPSNPYPEYSEVRLLYSSQPNSISNTELTGLDTVSDKIWAVSGDGNIIAYYDSSDSSIKFLKLRYSTTSGKYYYTDSYQMYSNDTLITYTSPVYAISDLGIPGTVKKLAFSKMNTKSYRSSYECKLAVLSQADDGWYINVFTFSTKETDLLEEAPYYICELYNSNDEEDSETIYRRWKIKVKEDSDNMTEDNWDGAFKFSPYQDDIGQDMIVVGFGSNSRSEDKIYVRGFDLKEYFSDTSNTDYGMTVSHDIFKMGYEWVNRIYDFNFYNNNRLIEITGSFYITISDKQQLVVLSENKTTLAIHELGDLSNKYGLTHDGLYAVRDNKLYGITTNYVTGDLSIAQTAEISDVSLSDAQFADDNSFAIANGDVYAIDFVGNTAKKIDEGKYYITARLSGSNSWISNDGSGNYFFTEVEYDNKTVTGLVYNGQTYYKQVYPAGTLTAGQPDVRAGKTFIGYMGIPETGTMEVTE